MTHSSGNLIKARKCLRQIDAGQALPANGEPDKFEKCFAAGICRRAHWQEEGEQERC